MSARLDELLASIERSGRLVVERTTLAAADCATIAADPRLARAHEIRLVDVALDEAALATLLASPHLDGLRVLVLQNVGGAFAPLLAFPRLDRLEKLDLRFNDVSYATRNFYDGGDLSTPSYTVDPDPTCVALHARLGDRVLCDMGA